MDTIANALGVSQATVYRLLTEHAKSVAPHGTDGAWTYSERALFLDQGCGSHLGVR
jgi:hypothetical protein